MKKKREDKLDKYNEDSAASNVRKYFLNFTVVAKERVTLNDQDVQVRSLHPKYLEKSTIWCWPIGN